MTIKFWRVGCGDAITVYFEDQERMPRNLFIDSGYIGTYKNTIKKELQRIISRGERVDLWIITHTDRDHIGGVEAFIKDPSIANKEDLIGAFWFNWSSYTFLPLQSKISVEQGMRLRDYLFSIDKLSGEEIVVPSQTIEWYGLKITILSPDIERLSISKKEWKETEANTRISSAYGDYNESIEALLQQPFEEDINPWNGGSIAFILSQAVKKILFLGDSYPTVVINSLKQLGYSSSNKLSLDYIKLSHHGSKRNFDPALLEIVECSNFIILANGLTHSLPNKWTLAQIIGSRNRSEQIVDFYFNDDNLRLRSIFADDNDIKNYRFRCHYNTENNLAIQLT